MTRRFGFSFVAILIGVILLVAMGAGGVYWVKSQSSDAVFSPVLAKVTSGDFVANVLCDGELQSSENVEIKCEVRARNGVVNVLQVVPEGTRVSAGDFLVSLDSTSFEKELEQQRIAVANAQTQKIRSFTDFETAVVSLEEYENGTFEEKKTELSMNLIAAKQDLEIAQENFGYSQKMQAKGFITKQQLDTERLAVEQGKRKIELVEKQLSILEDYSRKKESIRLNSDIQAAKVKKENDEEALRVETEKLQEILMQIEKCTINVPAGVSGQVVYNKESSRRGGGTDWVLEPGAEVREGQVMVRLPNPEKMEVKALVQEQSITSIRVGMPAEIRVNALNNQLIKGVVTKVNQYAEQGGWMASSVRKYAVFVRILNGPPELITGMKASVSIQTRMERERVQIPVQGVYGFQDRYFCLLKTGENSFESREVKIEGDNSMSVVIKEGLEPGQEVVLNPGEYKDLLELPEAILDRPIEMTDDEKKMADEQLAKAKQQPSEGGSRVDEMFTQHDSDKDGSMSATELAAVEEPMRTMFSRADANKDGSVSKAELTAAFAAFERMRANGGPGGGGPGGGGPGGGGPGGGGAGPGGPGGGRGPGGGGPGGAGPGGPGGGRPGGGPGRGPGGAGGGPNADTSAAKSQP
ncbi:MAG: HlyD family secretion protein [Planctomycetaceae bacterium]|nr:HlyD family secretion protein [Planctomycetaceae bacterium]